MMTGVLVAEDAGWQLPDYAQAMLWVAGGTVAIRATGPRGAFSLDGPVEDRLFVTWGTPDGPPLAVWTQPGEPWVLGWSGAVAVGGFVERLHVLEAHGLELVIAEIEGGLLAPGYRRLPTLAEMQQGAFRRTGSEDHPIPRNFTYTFLAEADSIYAEYLHHAMVSELAVDCFATLGPDDGGWHEIVGLPLLLDSISLLAPGYHGI
jgi:hypothetical protein